MHCITFSAFCWFGDMTDIQPTKKQHLPHICKCPIPEKVEKNS